jgi:hypothetical protein
MLNGERFTDRAEKCRDTSLRNSLDLGADKKRGD